MTRYTQNDEQDIILRKFEGKIGRFLDIGAHDGINLSNTRALVEMGWGGVFVEPNPTHFLTLLGHYGGMEPRFKLFNCAVDSGFGVKRLFWNYQWPAYSSTLSPEKAEEFKANDYSKSFYVATLAVGSLKEFGPFDFVSLDIEGIELQVLCQMEKVLEGAQLICVEYCPKSKQSLENSIKSHGFDIVHTTPENLMAERVNTTNKHISP